MGLGSVVVMVVLEDVPFSKETMFDNSNHRNLNILGKEISDVHHKYQSKLLVVLVLEELALEELVALVLELVAVVLELVALVLV